MTSKLQLTVPKSIAEAYRIAPGSELIFEAAGEVIHLRHQRANVAPDKDARLQRFQQAWQRQLGRNQRYQGEQQSTDITNRGWTREELYER